MRVFHHTLGGGSTSSKSDQVRSATLRVEKLEERTVPSTVFAVTAPGAGGTQNLVRFDSATPGNVTSVGAISGLAGGAGEVIVGMDFRPSNGMLYAVGNTAGTGRVYTINTTTGAATVVNAANTFMLTGTAFGVDFNPVPDAIRVVSNTGQNLRVNANTGALAGTDTPLTIAPTDPASAQMPSVVASGYTNNFAGATSTLLFGIDSNLDRLMLQGSAATGPNGGVLFSRGPLGFDTNDQAGLDITSTNNAFASLTSPVAGTTNSTFASIDLQRGTATVVGNIGDATTGLIQDIAITIEPTPPPPPTAAAATTVFAVTAPGSGGTQSLISFAPSTPGSVTTIGPISGLAGGPGEVIVGMDFRPSNGMLYAIGNTNGTGRVYTINTSTGAATVVNAANTFTLTGTAFGVDFNPVPDAIRVVSNTGQNLRISPTTGALLGTDTPLAYAGNDLIAAGQAPNVAAAGYTNNFAGTTSTLLFDIDSTQDTLVLQGNTNPNGGVLITRGQLGFDTTDRVGLDITAGNVAFASLTGAAPGTTNSLFATVDLERGLVTPVAEIGDVTTGQVQDIAVAPVSTSTGPATGTGTSTSGASQNAIINQLVIANLQKVFAQPLPPQIALALIVQVSDVNGDGFADVIALVGLNTTKRGGAKGIALFRLVFDGLSPSSALIGTPMSLGTF